MTKTTAPAENVDITSLGNDELRAELERRERFNANVDDTARLARHSARLTESRRGYIEDVDAADAECQAAEAALDKVWADPSSSLEHLFAAYVAVMRVDGRRAAVAAATADQLEMLDELPQSPLSGAPQSRRPRFERKHDPRLDPAQSFSAFIDSAVAHWVGLDMAGARNGWLDRLDGITASAAQQARAAAEKSDDGHADVAVP